MENKITVLLPFDMPDDSGNIITKEAAQEAVKKWNGAGKNTRLSLGGHDTPATPKWMADLSKQQHRRRVWFCIVTGIILIVSALIPFISEYKPTWAQWPPDLKAYYIMLHILFTAGAIHYAHLFIIEE